MSKWEMVRLGDVCTFLSGYAFDSKLFTDCKENMPLIRIRDVKRGYTKTYTSEKYDEKYIITKGDILIGMDGEFNLGRWNSNDALLNQRICKINATAFMDIEYLKYALLKELQKIEDETSFVTVKHLSTKKLENIVLPMPPIREQSNISTELDKISDLIAKRKQQIEKLDLLVKAKFVEMFGDPVTNPMGWDLEYLNKLCSKIGSGSTPKGGKECYQASGVSLIRSMNVHDNYFKYKDLAHINDIQSEQLKNVEIKENDVLLNITGASITRTCVVPSAVLPARVNQHVCILRCTDKIQPVYLNYLLSNVKTKRKLLNIGKANGATREALTKQQLEMFSIPLAPLPLQTQFATYVQQVEQNKEKLEQSLSQLELLYKQRMQYYFE